LTAGFIWRVHLNALFKRENARITIEITHDPLFANGSKSPNFSSTGSSGTPALPCRTHARTRTSMPSAPALGLTQAGMAEKGQEPTKAGLARVTGNKTSNYGCGIGRERRCPSGGEIGRDVSSSQARCRAKRATVQPLRVRKYIRGGERRRAFVHSTQDRQCKSDGDLCPSCRAGSPCARQGDEPPFRVHWSWHIRREDAPPSKMDFLSRPYRAWLKSTYRISRSRPRRCRRPSVCPSFR
jgi:hypothetical protein